MKPKFGDREGGRRKFLKNLSPKRQRIDEQSHSLGFGRSANNPSTCSVQAWSCHFAHKCATQQYDSKHNNKKNKFNSNEILIEK